MDRSLYYLYLLKIENFIYSYSMIFHCICYSAQNSKYRKYKCRRRPNGDVFSTSKITHANYFMHGLYYAYCSVASTLGIMGHGSCDTALVI